MDRNTGEISIYNDGSGIDVDIHPTEKDEGGKPLMIPEMIFGHLLTSINYDKDEKKIVGGKNGYGAKLTNIFSKSFTIETVDSAKKKKYTQTFTNNMLEKTKPKITKYTSKPYTKITWIADFQRFGITEYSQDMISFMERRIYDIGGITDKKISVYLNNEKLKIKGFEGYSKLYVGESDMILYEDIDARWSLGISVSKTDKFEQISFVNGIATPKGGKHVDYLSKLIISSIKDHIKKKHKKDIMDNYVKNYLKLFINSVIENPSFDSQTKER